MRFFANTCEPHRESNSGGGDFLYLTPQSKTAKMIILFFIFQKSERLDFRRRCPIPEARISHVNRFSCLKVEPFILPDSLYSHLELSFLYSSVGFGRMH